MKNELFNDFNFDNSQITYSPKIWNTKNEILDFIEQKLEVNDNPEYIILLLEKIKLDISSVIFVLKSARFISINDENLIAKKNHEPKICDNELLLSQVEEILATEKTNFYERKIIWSGLE